VGDNDRDILHVWYGIDLVGSFARLERHVTALIDARSGG
jgi:hypothetical protein